MRSLQLAAVAVFAVACASADPNKEPPPKPFTATKWELIMDIPPQGELPYVRFGDGRMEGYGGCSRFVARYVQDTVGARAIAIGKMEIDRRLCDVSARAAEARMLEVLQSASSYSVTADILSMTGSGGTLRFHAVDPAKPVAAAAPAPPSAGGLTGTRWKAVVASGVDEAAIPWLEFAEGRVAGYTGCNMLSGAWRMEGSELRIGSLVTTKRACLGPGGENEKRVLSTLNERARITRDGPKLVAVAPDGERFEFSEVR
jgi:heat shock protein HslJ